VTVAADLDALQRTLAAEHAAVWVLGALGGRASNLPASALREAIDAAYDAHLQRRDRLRIVIAATGADPVAAEPAYRLPPHLTTREQIAAVALRVQRGCVTTYGALVAASDGADRRWAVQAMAQTALTERDFGGHPQALPGWK
jgi:hypothetical protein